VVDVFSEPWRSGVFVLRSSAAFQGSHQMRRRDFIALLGGAAATWPLSADAEEIPEVGFLSSSSSDASGRHVAAFLDGLRERGFVEKRNVSFTSRWAEGDYDRLGGLARELVARRVKVIAATGGVISAQAAMKATSTIPIVFIVGDDPASPNLRMVASLNHPGGNATGASVISTGIATKRLQLLGQALGIREGNINLGILVNPYSVTTAREIASTKAAVAQFNRVKKAQAEENHDQKNAAEPVKLDVVEFNASSKDEITKAIDSAAQQKVAALLVSADAYFTAQRKLIVPRVASHAIAAMYPWREYVDVGGLMSYGAELTWGYRLIGNYAGRILKGENPGDIPVEQADRIELIVNLKTAKALGIRIDPTLVALANEVVE
jgi:putative tryptophan/tyrosine transport system substrate-binding protein